jgi:molybdenum cofactor cytidylyltransferase
MLHNQMLGLYAAQTIATLGFSHVVAVCDPAQTALNDAYRALGIKIIANARPDAGQSASLHLGIAALALHSPASIMITLADMPFVTATHLQALYLAFHAAGTSRSVASHNGDAQLPPAILPETLYRSLAEPQILAQADQGAKSYLADAILVHGDADMLRDIDRADQLAALNISENISDELV